MDARCICAPSEFDRRTCSKLVLFKPASQRLALLYMSTTRAVWLFVAALTAIRLSLLAATNLSFDEAHYWMWSERLAPAYFSKGPGIAFIIRASTAFFGATEFGVRFLSPIIGAATTLLLYYFTRHLFNERAAFWTV